jgi:cytoskeletal protein CcmA (bactofilin family)
MGKKDKALQTRTTDTVIGKGIIFERALLKGSGVVRIDGCFTGTIDIKGHVILGETCSVNGEIYADSGLFAGRYQGQLHIRGALHLTKSANVTGNIESVKLIMDEGAIFNGTCNIPSPEGSGGKKQVAGAIAAKAAPASGSNSGSGSASGSGGQSAQARTEGASWSSENPSGAKY